jgi:hypothetical protein
VVQHNRRLGKSARDGGRFFEMPERHPQIPGQPVLVEQGKAAQPALILHRPRRTRLDAIGRGCGDRLRSDAAHQRPFGMRGDHLLGVLGVEPGVRNDGAGEPVLRLHLADPAGLAELIGPVPFGLAMNRRQDVVAGGVMPVILGQVVPLKRPVIAHEERFFLGAAQPGVLLLP